MKKHFLNPLRVVLCAVMVMAAAPLILVLAVWLSLVFVAWPFSVTPRRGRSPFPAYSHLNN